MGRYRLVCVADLPDLGSYDDRDEAIAASTAHYEPYDTVTGKFITPTCQEELDAARARLRARKERGGG